MRTRADIVQHIAGGETDFLGVQTAELGRFLPRKEREALLLPVPKGWRPERLTLAGVRGDLVALLDTVWPHVVGHAGWETYRAVERCGAWLWLLEDHALYEECRRPASFPPFGAPVFGRLAAAYKRTIPDDLRVHRMITGESCVELCPKCG